MAAFAGVGLTGYGTALAVGAMAPEGWLPFFFGAACVAVLAVATGSGFARVVARPLSAMRRRAEAVFDRDTPAVSRSELREIDALGQAVEHMQRQLDDQVNDANARRRELEIVLNSMTEGFLAVNEHETVFKLNPAASRMLQIDVQHAFGRGIRELVRVPEFHDLVEAILRTGEPGTTEIQFRTPRATERMLSVSGSCIRDDAGAVAGAVFILVDVTQLRNLETLRRDFVANVSHELKTPITSIKGYTETLLDGALDEPETARRFLEIVARQSDRLHAIIEDLLSLARIERVEEAQDAIRFRDASIADVFEAAVMTCAKLAETQDAQVVVECPADLSAEIEASLLEQAVTNLLQNAIQYSPRGSTVRLAARREGALLRIEVVDRGPGIAREHLPRLFERFYRVDTSRSRELGGTGLGLAIVKHIAHLHGGDVRVDSEPGRGSTFALVFPAQRPAAPR